MDSNGKDPDSSSPTLKNQHKILWRKPLPNGQLFDLRDEPGKYLSFKAQSEKFYLTSDSISNSFRDRKSYQSIINSIDKNKLDHFQLAGSTIAARIVFPGNRIGNQATINVERGFNRQISDRFDLTLECIRLQYLGENNPLSNLLGRYWSFFELFKDFSSYVVFFMLEDLVSEKDSRVKFLTVFKGDFPEKPLPQSVTEYIEYMEATMKFLEARKVRINNWVTSNYLK